MRSNASEAATASARARQGFATCFGSEAEALFFSPGRVNLIGEHTDYNDGWVLPMAIQQGTFFAVSPSHGKAVRVWSEHFQELVEVPLASLTETSSRGHWQDYLAGIMTELLPHAQTHCGLDVFVHTTLPAGAGLSSSASLTAGFGFVINDFWHCQQTRAALAEAARRAENEFVGLACGILDPFSVLMGKRGKVLRLNCGTMDWRQIGFPDDSYRVIAVHSGVTRRLAESGYNTRRSECEQALDQLRHERALSSLSDLTTEDLPWIREIVQDQVLLRRVRHVLSENERVLAAAAALESNDMHRFGEMLAMSHESLRADYEVSCGELDLLVEIAMALQGVAGAKMTGAGFGGSIVAVVEADAADAFTDEVGRLYNERTGLQASSIVCRPSAGVSGPDRSE